MNSRYLFSVILIKGARRRSLLQELIDMMSSIEIEPWIYDVGR
jgi:hypothetical protein